jgi:transglutaminase/protease-like cytokinesis protein 3
LQIKFSIIEGYIKNSPNQIGNMGILDHAWNSIKIDNEYYNIDLTWALDIALK